VCILLLTNLVFLLSHTGHFYLELKGLPPGHPPRLCPFHTHSTPSLPIFSATPTGHFYLELKGLAPGRYHYKYIVDNTWAVDGLAPKVLDSQVGVAEHVLAHIEMPVD
jgi:hypothetical protein